MYPDSVQAGQPIPYTVLPIVKEHVQENSEVVTDEFCMYDTLSEEGSRHSVCHRAREYVKYCSDGEQVHTNEMEGFWYPKNAIKGVHRGASDRHLRGYVNECAFRQSNHNNEQPMFFAMLRQIVPVERLAAQVILSQGT